MLRKMDIFAEKPRCDILLRLNNFQGRVRLQEHHYDYDYTIFFL